MELFWQQETESFHWHINFEFNNQVSDTHLTNKRQKNKVINRQIFSAKVLLSKMPRVEGIFRQRRQSYNTKSVLRLDCGINQQDSERESTASSRRTSNTFRRTIAKHISSETVKPHRSSSRRKKKRLLRCLQNNGYGDGKTVSKDFLRRTESKTDISVTTSTHLPRISRYTSVVRFDSRSLENATLTEPFLQDRISDTGSGIMLPIILESSLLSLDKKQVQTDASWLLEKIKKTVSIMAVVCKAAVDRETQKAEKIAIRSVKDAGTQMMDYFTPSDLYCIEWMHRNLIEIKLNPFKVLEDETIKEASVITCCTSEAV